MPECIFDVTSSCVEQAERFKKEQHVRHRRLVSGSLNLRVHGEKSVFMANY